jgi:hypothetical protein
MIPESNAYFENVKAEDRGILLMNSVVDSGSTAASGALNSILWVENLSEPIQDKENRAYTLLFRDLIHLL